MDKDLAILDQLQRIPPRKLEGLIGRRFLREVDRILGSRIEHNAESLSNVLLGLYGQDLLARRDVRSALLANVDGDELRAVAKAVRGTSFDAVADNATLLSALPWKPDSAIVSLVRSTFDIPDRYLPRADYSHPTVEPLEPVGDLPPLHSYQRNVLRTILSEVDRGLAMIVQMPTGSGKTRTVVQALLRATESRDWLENGGIVLWVAHSEELCEQAISAFRKVWLSLGERETQLVRLWSGRRVPEEQLTSSVVVTTYQTLAALCGKGGPLFQRLAENVRCIVADEAHMALAPTFEKALSSVTNGKAVLLGLTATPGRSIEAEAENRRLAALFGGNLIIPSEFKDGAVSYLRKEGVLAHVERIVVESGIQVDDAGNKSETSEVTDTILNRLATSRARNRIIVDALVTEVEAGRQTLVFTCGVEHSRLLTTALLSRGLPAAFVDSTVGGQRRRSLVRQFASGELSLLLNFGVSSTGFDAPGVQTVVITRPTASVVLYSQMVGRGLRGPKMGGRGHCRLVDVKDNFTRFGGVEAVYDVFRDYWD